MNCAEHPATYEPGSLADKLVRFKNAVAFTLAVVAIVLIAAALAWAPNVFAADVRPAPARVLIVGNAGPWTTTVDGAAPDNAKLSWTALSPLELRANGCASSTISSGGFFLLTVPDQATASATISYDAGETHRKLVEPPITFRFDLATDRRRFGPFEPGRVTATGASESDVTTLCTVFVYGPAGDLMQADLLTLPPKGVAQLSFATAYTSTVQVIPGCALPGACQNAPAARIFVTSDIGLNGAAITVDTGVALAPPAAIPQGLTWGQYVTPAELLAVHKLGRPEAR